MNDLNELEMTEEDIEEIVSDMSIMSGFELGAINTVMPIITKRLFPKYDEMPFKKDFAESSPQVDKANKYRFPDTPESLPKNKYTH